MKTKRVVTVFLVIVLWMSIVAMDNSVYDVYASRTSYTRTYTEMIDYNFGEKNQGFYLVPNKAGKYPVIFMFHGAAEKSSNNAEYRAYLMDTVNKWVALGYMDPMIIVVPNIERENSSDNWSCYGFYNYVANPNRFESLLNNIKNGQSEFENKVDHTKKFSVTGFSMGGVEALFIGTRYAKDFINVGACSPSYMYYHITGTSDDGWVKKNQVNFSSDPNTHLFMGYGTKEEYIFHENVDRYNAVYKENKSDSQKDFVIYSSYPDGHNWNTFSREIFCFVYYMKFDSLPSDATIEKACASRYLDYGDSNSSGGSSSSKDSLDSGKNGASLGSGSRALGSGVKVTNQWIDGCWYGSDGKQNYSYKGSWKQNSKGWWFEDTSGWYAKSQWQKIDGDWYYFESDGYLATSQWVDGYWVGSDGAWNYKYVGSWKHGNKGWWFGDTSGWYAKNQWQKIDGSWYYFDATGYMVTNKRIEGYWVGSDGAYY